MYVCLLDQGWIAQIDRAGKESARRKEGVSSECNQQQQFLPRAAVAAAWSIGRADWTLPRKEVCHRRPRSYLQGRASESVYVCMYVCMYVWTKQRRGSTSRSFFFGSWLSSLVSSGLILPSSTQIGSCTADQCIQYRIQSSTILAASTDGVLATVVHGKIPDDLCGHLFRCGPGRIAIGKKRYGHW